MTEISLFGGSLLTHFVVTQQPLLLHVPCNKFSGGVNQRKRVGMTYLPTMEVKNVNRCFRHLLITCCGFALPL